MIRPTMLLLPITFLLLPPTSASAQSIYRWRDANGGLHFSNQSNRTPTDASAIELPPLGSIQVPAPAKRSRLPKPRSRTVPSGRPCGPADPSGLADAVSLNLPAESPATSLTLLIGGVPYSTSPDSNVQRLTTSWDPDAPHAHLGESAIAYPVGSSCPTAPPLVRYATNPRRQSTSRGLCDDYRRAFAQIGVATSRDAGIARSFRDLARSFVRVALEGNVAAASGFRLAVDRGIFTSDAAERAPYMTVPLDPWIVAAHVSQTGTLANETDQLVERLTIALEEIDRAARASGCWN